MKRSTLIEITEAASEHANLPDDIRDGLLAVVTDKKIERLAVGRWFHTQMNCGCPMVAAGYYDRESDRFTDPRLIAADRGEEFVSKFDTEVLGFPSDARWSGRSYIEIED